MMGIGDEVRRVRKNAGMTQQELSMAMGRRLLRAHLSQIENGKRSPSWRTLIRIATALGMRITVRFEELPAGTLEREAAEVV